MAKTTRGSGGSGLKLAEIPGRVVKPVMCALGIAIPTSLAGFLRHRSHHHNGFAGMFAGGWPQYVDAIVAPLEKLRPEISRLNVQLHLDLTLERFGEVCRSTNVAAIILFAHWNTECVEFFDGFADVDSIVATVPPSYTGVVDLCVCQQRGLAGALRRERPDCIVGFTNRDATPYRWLRFYVLVFKYLHEYEMTYLEAVAKSYSAVFDDRGHTR